MFRKILVSIICMHRGTGITALLMVLGLSDQNFRTCRTFVFQNCSGMKKVMDNKNREGLSRFSVRTFLSQSAEKNRMVDPCFLKRSGVEKNVD